MSAKSRFLNVTVFGDKELEQAFGALSFGAQKRVFRPALRAGMKVIHTATKARVPAKTGNLRRAIKLRAGTRSRRRIGIAIFIDKSKLVLPSPTGFYPAHVELGFRTNLGAVIPPRSYLRSAFDENKERAVGVMEQTAGQKIDDLWANPPKNLQILREPEEDREES